MIQPFYRDDQATIYHGDCRDIWPSIDTDGMVIITDPPYGINGADRHQPGAAEWEPIAGDDDTDMAAWLMSAIGDRWAVVFGANTFPELLPHRGRWLCWDKRLTADADRMLGSPFELAWINTATGFDRMIRCLHGGVVNANGHGLKRVHPTEKPVSMLERVISLAPPGVIVDPFAGSGTTIRAAVNAGRQAIGIELEQRYCHAAVDRLRQLTLGLDDER